MSLRKAPVLKIAPPYDDELVRRIEQGFSDKLGSDIHFRVEEDPSLLCGFIAYADGTVYDVSGLTQLSEIKEYLMDLAVVHPPQAEEADDAL